MYVFIYISIYIYMYIYIHIYIYTYAPFKHFGGLGRGALQRVVLEQLEQLLSMDYRTAIEDEQLSKSSNSYRYYYSNSY